VNDPVALLDFFGIEFAFLGDVSLGTKHHMSPRFGNDIIRKIIIDELPLVVPDVFLQAEKEGF
jgi:hypothetical protein